MAVKEKNKEKMAQSKEPKSLWTFATGKPTKKDIDDHKLTISELNLSNRQLVLIYENLQISPCGLLVVNNFVLTLNEVSSKNYALFGDQLTEINLITKEENIAVNMNSYQDLLNFDCFKKNNLPALFLLDNGNIRALWRDGQSQIGLQFLGNSLVQYVLLREGEVLQTAYGRIETNSIMPLIAAMKLEFLLTKEV